MVCDTVTSWRQVYKTAGNEVGAIQYYSSHTDSTPLRCCLKDGDFVENVNACTSVDDEEKSYSFNEGTGQCTEHTCIRTNLYLPNTDWQRDAILILRGDMCVDQPDTIVDDSVCCYEIQEGCTKEEPFPNEYQQPSMCLDDECTQCSLSYYAATNYFSDDVLTRRIVDYDGGLLQATFE